MASDEQRAAAVRTVVRTVRSCGLPDTITDRQLIEDNIHALKTPLPRDAYASG